MAQSDNRNAKWIGLVFLGLVPLLGLAYWLTRPDATDDINDAIATASASIESASTSGGAGSGSGTGGNAGNDNGGTDWQFGGDEGTDNDDDDDNFPLPLADAHNLIANAELLSKLSKDVTRPELSSDPTVGRLMKAAKRFIKKQGSVPLVLKQAYSGRFFADLAGADR